MLIDDSYNANPDSVRAAIDLLAGLPGDRLLVLGDMGEVGEQGPAFHEEMGIHARNCGIDAMWLLGKATQATARAFGPRAKHFGEDIKALIEALAATLAPSAGAAGTTGRQEKLAILVKGSRFMGMERVVKALTEDQHVKVPV